VDKMHQELKEARFSTSGVKEPAEDAKSSKIEKGPSRRRLRAKFFDLEAEEEKGTGIDIENSQDEDEDYEDEDEDEDLDGFIDRSDLSGDAVADFTAFEDAEDAQVRAIADRFERQVRAMGYRVEEPSLREKRAVHARPAMTHGPKYFSVPCLKTKESSVLNAIHKLRDQQLKTSGQSLLLDAFSNPGKGWVYVQAEKRKTVEHALVSLPKGLPICSWWRKGPLHFLSQNDLENVRKQLRNPSVRPGQWVRLKRTPYCGDLAQVVQLKGSNKVVVRVVPRLDYIGIAKKFREKKKGVKTSSKTSKPGGKPAKGKNGKYSKVGGRKRKPESRGSGKATCKRFRRPPSEVMPLDHLERSFPDVPFRYRPIKGCLEWGNYKFTESGLLLKDVNITEHSLQMKFVNPTAAEKKHFGKLR